MTDDLKKLLADNTTTFTDRSVARELTEMMFSCTPAGSIALDVGKWSAAWGLSESVIWNAIDRLQELRYWDVQNGVAGNRLVCESISGSAIALGKKKKRNTLKAIKEISSVERAHALRLEAVGPSIVSEVAEVIPKNKRKEALASGYPGWLPSAFYWVDGIVFKPDQGMINKLKETYPELCIDSSLSLMFDDLRNSRDKPTIPNFPYWITQWIKANPTRKVVEQSVDDIAKRAASKMDDY